MAYSQLRRFQESSMRIKHFVVTGCPMPRRLALPLLLSWLALLVSACSSPVDRKWERADMSAQEQSKVERSCQDEARRSAEAKGLVDRAVERGRLEAQCMNSRGFHLSSPRS
jgi:hypothetical protein